MSYARIGIWSIAAGANRDELTGLLRDELLPSYQAQAGFIDYLAVTVGDAEVVGVQVWEEQDQAATAGAQSGDRLRDRIGGRAALQSWYHGPVAIDVSPTGTGEPAYARIGIWDIAPDVDTGKLVEQAREGLIPIFEEQTGLVSYRAILSVEGRLVVVHTWESEAAASQGMQATGQWLQETVANRLALVARYDGPVGLHAERGGR